MSITYITLNITFHFHIYPLLVNQKKQKNLKVR